MSHPGEMAVLRDILWPDVAVVTEIGPAHIEFFDSVRAIAEEKAALLERLPADGWAVLDDDDEWAGVLRERCAAEVVSCSPRRREVDYGGMRRRRGGSGCVSGLRGSRRGCRCRRRRGLWRRMR